MTAATIRSEEHASELQSLTNLVCRLLLEKKIDYVQRELHYAIVDEVDSILLAAACTPCAPAPLSSPVAVLVVLRFFFSSFLFFLNEGEPPELYTFPHHGAFPI